MAGTAYSAPKISVPIIAAAMGAFKLPDKTPLIPATNNARAFINKYLKE